MHLFREEAFGGLPGAEVKQARLHSPVEVPFRTAWLKTSARGESPDRFGTDTEHIHPAACAAETILAGLRSQNPKSGGKPKDQA